MKANADATVATVRDGIKTSTGRDTFMWYLKSFKELALSILPIANTSKFFK